MCRDATGCSITEQPVLWRNNKNLSAFLSFPIYHFTFIHSKPIPTVASPTRMNRYPNNRFPWHCFCFILSDPHNIISKIRTSNTDKGKPSEMAGRKATDPKHLPGGWATEAKPTHLPGGCVAEVNEINKTLSTFPQTVLELSPRFHLILPTLRLFFVQMFSIDAGESSSKSSIMVNHTRVWDTKRQTLATCRVAALPKLLRR